jgi:hypothetical protein
MPRTIPQNAAAYGVDLGKNIFHVVGFDGTGAVVQRVKLRRDTLLNFFERANSAVVGMEACPGSQWLARKLSSSFRDPRRPSWKPISLARKTSARRAGRIMAGEKKRAGKRWLSHIEDYARSFFRPGTVQVKYATRIAR